MECAGLAVTRCVLSEVRRLFYAGTPDAECEPRQAPAVLAYRAEAAVAAVTCADVVRVIVIMISAARREDRL